MCGICGFNYHDPQIVKLMADEIRHRGPDGEGFHLDKQVSLGHRRLSIIDVDGGKNPIYNEDKSICIIFNGEIYNYKDLKKDLIDKGHRFATNADTDVILHGYEEYGVDILEKLNGMFAFCIYDSKKSLLFLARDRFGIKPLYYFFNKGTFIFASEIKALLKNPLVPKKPNEEVIAQYLQNNLVPEDRKETFFKNIYKLLPSHYALVAKGKLTIKKYYSLPNVEYAVDKKVNEKETIKKYRELITDAVKIHLISDVPVGACLSGGMDSSTIVALIDKMLEQEVKETDSVRGRLNCFSAVYNDKSVDERAYITEAVKNKQVQSHYIFPEAKGFWRELEDVVYHQDEPTESIAVYAQYCVMRLASTKVKVLLDGQGSDECLAGYIPYYRHYLLDLLKSGNIYLFLQEFIAGFGYVKDMLRTFFRLKKSQDESSNFFNIPVISKTNYLTSSFMSLTERQLFDLHHNLPKVLRYEDKNAMAFGIESRIPFLDYRLVEYSFSLPESIKIKKGWTKYILRKAMKDLLPSKIVNRKDKFGYPVPDYDWLVDNKKDILKFLESNSFKNRKYFNAEDIKKAFIQMCQDRNKKYLTSYFWRIINLEVWFRVFIDKD